MEFISGESYKAIVNGEVTNSFVGREPAGRPVVVKESPVESVELIILESFPPLQRGIHRRGQQRKRDFYSTIGPVVALMGYRVISRSGLL